MWHGAQDARRRLLDVRTVYSGKTFRIKGFAAIIRKNLKMGTKERKFMSVLTNHNKTVQLLYLQEVYSYLKSSTELFLQYNEEYLMIGYSSVLCD